jgi:hypothetical protein
LIKGVVKVRKSYINYDYSDLYRLSDDEIKKRIHKCEKELEDAYDILFRRCDPLEDGEKELQKPESDTSDFHRITWQLQAGVSRLYYQNVSQFNTTNILIRILYEENQLRLLKKVKKDKKKLRKMEKRQEEELEKWEEDNEDKDEGKE